ncbi:MAG: hypothetical protein IJ012_05365 [Clostridia bacterium]|nr:hypothetical protein [Clostridia bacterium]
MIYRCKECNRPLTNFCVTLNKNLGKPQEECLCKDCALENQPLDLVEKYNTKEYAILWLDFLFPLFFIAILLLYIPEIYVVVPDFVKNIMFCASALLILLEMVFRREEKWWIVPGMYFVLSLVLSFASKNAAILEFLEINYGFFGVILVLSMLITYFVYMWKFAQKREWV